MSHRCRKMQGRIPAAIADVIRQTLFEKDSEHLDVSSFCRYRQSGLSITIVVTRAAFEVCESASRGTIAENIEYRFGHFLFQQEANRFDGA